MLPERKLRLAHIRTRLAVALALAIAGVHTPATAQNAQSTQADPWYRVEIMVFRQPGESGFAAEAWPPEPSLDYPPRYRHLVNRDLADRRHDEFTGSRSQINAQGIQRLLLAEPRTRSAPVLESLESLDSLEDSLVPKGAASVAVPSVTVGTQQDSAESNGGSDLPLDGTPIIEPPRPDARLDVDDPELPLPTPAAFTLLPEDLRELNRDASRMRSAGYDVLVHSAWVQPVTSENKTRAIILDRSGDPDAPTWPAVQGSISIYLARYLHMNTRLWLNTHGDYLHPDWRMPEPPRAPESLLLALPPLHAWHRQRDHGNGPEMMPTDGLVAQPLRVPAELPDATAPAMAEETQDIDSNYPWRHAILLEQSRRMRGGELHYIDHPVLGVLIKMTLLDDTDWLRVYQATTDWQWEDCHQVLGTGREGITRSRENHR